MRRSNRRRAKKKDRLWIKGLGALGLSVLAVCVGVLLVSTLVRPRGAPEEKPVVLKDVRIQVLNGCGVNGVAQDVANVLRLNGYDVVEVGNAHSFDYPTTLVLDRVGSVGRGGRSSPEGGNVDVGRGGRASDIAEALGVGSVIIQRIEGAPYDATVIVGKDFKHIARR